MIVGSTLLSGSNGLERGGCLWRVVWVVEASSIYYAHSSSVDDRSTWHRLVDHLKDTAHLAGAFGCFAGIGRAAFLAGLMHDLGKYTAGFQARLAGAKEQVDHSTAGAAVVAGLAQGDDRYIA
jgi:CRISPR-associated endonuclease/helicase Cas3